MSEMLPLKLVMRQSAIGALYGVLFLPKQYAAREVLLLKTNGTLMK